MMFFEQIETTYVSYQKRITRFGLSVFSCFDYEDKLKDDSNFTSEKCVSKHSNFSFIFRRHTAKFLILG